jgi:O-antigen/teichoic acid export membrane protein
MTADVTRFLKPFGFAFILRVAGAALAFLLNVAIGRLLGTSEAGLYYLALSIATIASVVTRLGLENTVLRFVASYAGEEDWARVRSVLRYALIWSGGASITLALIVIIGAPWIAAGVFDTPPLAPMLAVIILSVLSVNLMTLSSEALKGISMAGSSTLVSSIIYPTIALVLLWPAFSIFGTLGAAVAYLGGTLMAAAVGLLIWKRTLSNKPMVLQKINIHEMRQSSRPLWVTMIINRALLPWLPVLMLGFLGTSADVGILGAATRIVMLVSFLLIAINTVVAPQFATLYRSQNISGLVQLASKVSGMITLASTPFFLVLFFSGDFVMSLFGSDFSAGGDVLALLTIGQMANVITGPVGLILMMGGFEKDARQASILSLVILVIAMVWAVPLWGMLGAALATTLSVIAGNLVSMLFVRRRIGYWVLPFYTFGKPLAK